eukprot:TRINITY_DN41008_c0_g1_i1.p1 TRINITY_DN41008_c0_g1~~TRINITY_DN41008_c0_g1_i1.p1  ORF type:complete len:682 (+),score=160.28 TRINITY_DN41008_c0_g1_i1:66-2111(+)
MVPEVSGDEPAEERPQATKIRPRSTSRSLLRQNSYRHSSSANDSEEQLQLLWSLWEAQQGLLQEDEVLQQAAAVQQEIVARTEGIRLELQEAEAELEKSLSLHSAQRCEDMERSTRDEDWDDRLETLRTENEQLQQHVHQVEQQLQKLEVEPFEHPEQTPGYGLSRSEMETLEAELKHWQRLQNASNEAHLWRSEELMKELSSLETRTKEQRWTLRDELTEACVETDVLESELEAARKGCELMLARLKEEELRLLDQVNQAHAEQEEADFSRNSVWSVHSGSICSDWSESTHLRTFAPFDLNEKLKGASVQEESPPPPTDQQGHSLLQELRGSVRGSHRTRTRSSISGYRLESAARGSEAPSQHATSESVPPNEGRRSDASNEQANSETTLPLSRRKRTSVAAFAVGAVRFRQKAVERSLTAIGEESEACTSEAANIPPPEMPRGASGEHAKACLSEATDVKVSDAPCSVIAGEMNAYSSEGGDTENKKLGTIRPDQVGGKATEELTAHPSDRDEGATAASENITPSGLKEAVARCRGVLEWTAGGDPGQDSPAWIGPCLFQVSSSHQGRLAFRSMQMPRSDGEGLSIPLLGVAAVRVDKQDPLGLTFIVRYKVGENRLQVLFRAPTKESQSSWVFRLCEAVRATRQDAEERRSCKADRHRPCPPTSGNAAAAANTVGYEF